MQTPAHTASSSSPRCIAFIGGGNMASAILGGLLRQGMTAAQLLVVEPHAPARAALQQQFGITALPQATPALADAELVVWAVKPQQFQQAAEQVCQLSQPAALGTAASTAAATTALHLSVAAGIGSDSLHRWLGSEYIVRAMPNTPALIGQGMTGLFARPAVTAAQRQRIEQVLAPTGALLWVDEEAQLDAVTALSGSGPAYVFYFLEAMIAAGTAMGLDAAQAQQLAQTTFSGAAELARRSSDAPAVLRERVTSKGGTTYAALQSMEAAALGQHFQQALHAARQRAQELGREFGGQS